MWFVRLKGDPNGLNQLCLVFDQSEFSVQKIENDYWLCSGQLNEDIAEQEVYDRGEALIEYLNSVLKLYSNKTDLFESEGYFLKSDGGALQKKFDAIGSLSIPLGISVIDNSLPDMRSYQLYRDYPNVRYVLSQFNQSKLDWYSLFNIFEAIEHDEQIRVFFKTSMTAIISWTNSTDKERFFGTANWYRHSPYKKQKGLTQITRIWSYYGTYAQEPLKPLQTRSSD